MINQVSTFSSFYSSFKNSFSVDRLKNSFFLVSSVNKLALGALCVLGVAFTAFYFYSRSKKQVKAAKLSPPSTAPLPIVIEEKSLSTRTKMSREKLATILKEQEKKFVETPDDGDCFYAAFAIGLKKVGIETTLHEVRLEASKLIQDLDKKDPETNWYKKAFNKQLGQEASYEEAVQYTNVNAELAKLTGKTARWGNPSLEGILLCQHYRVNLRVYEVTIQNGEDPNLRNDPNNYVSFAAGDEPLYPRPENRVSDDRTIDIAAYPGHFLGVVPLDD